MASDLIKHISDASFEADVLKADIPGSEAAGSLSEGTESKDLSLSRASFAR